MAEHKCLKCGSAEIYMKKFHRTGICTGIPEYRCKKCDSLIESIYEGIE